MRYIVKQKIFALGDNFTIRNEHGEECYRVKGKVFSLGDKLRIYDMQGNELVYIEQKLFRFLPEYSIYYLGNLYATVKREFSLFRPKFQIFGTHGQYRVEGNVWGMDFSIFRENELAAQVSKRWFSFSDTYGVDIIGDEDPVFMLALVIVLDQVLHDNNHNRD